MIKVVYCVRRRADVTEERFHRYWLEQHAALVRSVAPAIRACRYVQSHTFAPELNALLMASRGLAEPYDGITELWWDSMDTVNEVLASSEAAEAMAKLVADEATFIDFAASCMFATEEHTIFER
jgi:uncharacterized protein (TIGR02118 family)